MMPDPRIPETFRHKVINYVEENGSITNRECRELLGVDYDQAIKIFNTMLEDGQLIRVGKTSGTRYVLPDSVLPTE